MIRAANGGSLIIPEIGPVPLDQIYKRNKHQQEGNSQTDFLLQALGLPHIWTQPAVRPQPLYTGGESAPTGYAGNEGVGNTDTGVEMGMGMGAYGGQEQLHEDPEPDADMVCSYVIDGQQNDSSNSEEGGGLFHSMQGLSSEYGNQHLLDRLVAARSASDPNAVDIDEEQEEGLHGDSVAFRRFDNVLDKPLAATPAAAATATYARALDAHTSEVGRNRVAIAIDVISFDEETGEGSGFGTGFGTGFGSGFIHRAGRGVDGGGVKGLGLGLVLPPPVQKQEQRNAVAAAPAAPTVADSNVLDIDDL